MKLSPAIRKALRDEAKACLDTVRPLKFHNLSSLKNKRKQAQAQLSKGDSDVYVEGHVKTDELNDFVENAITLGEGVLQDCAAIEVPSSFLFDWGAFQYACAMAISYQTCWRKDPGKSRAGDAGGSVVRRGANIKKIWVARQLKAFMNDGDERHQAEGRLAKLIAKAIKENRIPFGTSEKWLSSLTIDKGALKDAYTQRRFSNSDVSAWAIRDCAIPALTRS